MALHEVDRRLILVVGDEPGRRVTLTRSLEMAGYDVRAVDHGAAALSAVAVRQPDAVLLGVGAREADAIDTCRRIRADPANRSLPVIVLSDPELRAVRGFEHIAAGIEAGADDFVERPYDGDELLRAIHDTVRLRRALADLDEAQLATDASAGDVDLAAIEPDRAGMAGLAHRLAAAVGLDGSDLRGAVFGALVHDIGHLGIPDAILTKPGPLTDAEWVAMRRHPEIGEGICRSFESSSPFASIVRHHHERWDGAGYPDGLRGEAIPIGARIVGLVDAFDAMVHDRPFRPARSVEAALTEIRREAGRQFDPSIVPLFEVLVRPPAADGVRRS